MDPTHNDPPPYYRLHVFACVNERPDDHPRGSCAGRGGLKLANYLKARGKELGVDNIRVNKAGCLDRCELGPVVVIYPEGVWYSIKTIEDAERVLQEHIIAGGRAADLMLSPADGP